MWPTWGGGGSKAFDVDIGASRERGLRENRGDVTDQSDLIK